jgi:hypothetical protein
MMQPGIDHRPQHENAEQRRERPTPLVMLCIRQRCDDRRGTHAEQRDRQIGDAALMHDRRQLRRRHQAAGRDQKEHQIHDPEQRRA